MGWVGDWEATPKGAVMARSGFIVGVWRSVRAAAAARVCREMPFWVWIGIGVLLLAAMPGCRAAPDLRPFDAATGALAASVADAGEMVAGDIERSTRDWPVDDRARASIIAARLREQWVGRAGLGAALRDYSAALVEISASGDDAEREAREFAAALGRLSAAVDLAIAPSRAGSAGISAGAAVYGAYMRDRAAQKLAARMTDATPTVDALLVVLDDDLSDLENALHALRDQAAFTIDDTPIGVMRPREERMAVRTLTLRQAELRSLLGLSGAPEAPSDMDRAAVQNELTAVESSLALALRRLEPIDAAIAGEKARLERDIAVIALTRSALRDWGAAHARALRACERDEPLRLDDLTRAVEQLSTRISESSNTFAHGGK